MISVLAKGQLQKYLKYPWLVWANTGCGRTDWTVLRAIINKWTYTETFWIYIWIDQQKSFYIQYVWKVMTPRWRPSASTHSKRSLLKFWIAWLQNMVRNGVYFFNNPSPELWYGARATFEQLFLEIIPRNEVTYVFKFGDRAGCHTSPLKETTHVRGTCLSLFRECLYAS